MGMNHLMLYFSVIIKSKKNSGDTFIPENQNLSTSTLFCLFSKTYLYDFESFTICLCLGYKR